MAAAFQRLGEVPYEEGLALQKMLVLQRVAGEIGDTVLLLEHPPTITLGRGARPEHILLDDAALRERGIEIRETDRGGDVTFHGPGQLVGYPIVDLSNRGRDVHRYLRDIEEVLIRTLGDFGLEGGRSPGATGVWIEDRKVAAIGVHVSRWVTSHGFSLNVGPDLSGFTAIVPCGIRDRGVTSLSVELGKTLTVDDVLPFVERRFTEVFATT